MAENKHAYLIIAHNNFNILKKLLEMIDSEHNDIYVHIDKRVKNFSKSEYYGIVKRANLYFTRRISVYWGHSSQIDCEMLLLKTCLRKGKYSFVHLLSGVDLPIKKQSEIYDFFESHPNTQFLQIGGIERHRWPLNNYYFTVRFKEGKVKRFIDTVTEIVSYKLKIDRLRKYPDLVLQKSANWFSITGECAEYIVKKKWQIWRMTRFTVCADELFLPTIIRNSRFWDQVYNKEASWDGHMRYIDRIRCVGSSPHTFTIEDKEAIENSKMLFARKFDEKVDNQIIEYVYARWKS